MGTTAEKLDKLKSTKEAIKAAIIAKGQPVADGDTFASYAGKIGAIQTGPDTSDATAANGDLLEGKTAYGANGKLTGTIPSKSAADLSASGDTVTVPAGYYPAQVSKAVAAAAQATPTISVSSSGLITASATQAAGYVAAGIKSATKQLTTQGAQTITPGTSNKTIASGRYLTGTQTIKGDANLKAENIVSGVSIFGVGGSAPSKNVAVFTNVAASVGYGGGSVSFSVGTGYSGYTPYIANIRASILGLFSSNDSSFSISNVTYSSSSGRVSANISHPSSGSGYDLRSMTATIILIEN